MGLQEILAKIKETDKKPVDPKKPLDDYLLASGISNEKRRRKIAEGIESVTLNQKASEKVAKYNSKSRRILRTILWTPLIAGLAYFSYICVRDSVYSIKDKLRATTEINMKVDEFPSAIDGADSVSKYNPKGASRVLIQIRQIHNNPNHDVTSLRDNMQADPQLLAITRDVQQDITNIIDCLYRTGLDNFYIEGFTDNPSPKNNFKNFTHVDEETLKYLDEKYRYIKLTQSKLDSEKADWLEAECEVIKNQIAYVLINYLQEKKIIELGVNAKYAEKDSTRIAMDKAEQEMKKEPRNAWNLIKTILHLGSAENKLDNIMMEQREDDLLEIITRNNDKIAITIYGGKHDWEDNIIEWNCNHPDDRFAYIRITPANYTKSEN